MISLDYICLAALVAMDHDEFIIGRDANLCNMIIHKNFTRVSNLHLRVVYFDGQFYAENLNSDNNSFFADNGQKIETLTAWEPGRSVILGGKVESEKTCRIILSSAKEVLPRKTTEHQTNTGDKVNPTQENPA